MQVNTQTIQRPSLYIDFFGLELMWNNEYLTYIQTTVNAVTSNLRKIAKTVTHNIKKSLKTKNIKNVLNNSDKKADTETRPMYPYPERTQKAITQYLACEASKKLYLEKKAQSHNGMSSLM